MDFGTALVLLLFLAAAMERLTEAVMALLTPIGFEREVRTGLAVVISLLFALTFVQVWSIDLVSPMVGYYLGDAGKMLTAFALGGGAGPIHQLVRWLEEARRADTV
jgi:hypothetical protein